MKGIDDRLISALCYPFEYTKYFNGENSRVSNNLIFWNKKSKKALFILPHWMGGILPYKILINKLKDDYTIVIYQLPNMILSDNIGTTIKYFDESQKNINNLANSLKNKGYRDFSILGSSLSCCLALMVANSDDKFKKIVLNLVGSDLAECVWCSNSPMVRNIKNKIAKKGIGLNNLKLYWKNISPINNIKNIKNRELLIFLSKNDKIIKYDYGQKFLDAIKKEKIKHKLEIDHIFGHYLSGFKQLQFQNRISSFLLN